MKFDVANGERKGYGLVGSFPFRDLQKELRLIGHVSHWYQDGQIVKTTFNSNILIWLGDVEEGWTKYDFSSSPEAVALEKSRNSFYIRLIKTSPHFLISLCKEALQPYMNLQSYVAKGFPTFTVEQLRLTERFRDAEISFGEFEYFISFSWSMWQQFLSKVNDKAVNNLFATFQSTLDIHLKAYGLNKPWFYEYCLSILPSFSNYQGEPSVFIQSIEPGEKDEKYDLLFVSLIQQDEEDRLQEMLTTHLKAELSPRLYEENIELWLNRVKAKVDDFKPIAKKYLKEKNLVARDEINKIHIGWLIQYLFEGKSQKQIADNYKGKPVGEDAVGKAIRKAANFLDVDLPKRRGKRSLNPTFFL